MRYADRVPEIRITINGLLALTVEQAAERYGLAHSSMSSALTRLRVEPDARLDGRKPIFLAERLDKIMADRSGRGAPGRSRRSAPTSRP